MTAPVVVFPDAEQLVVDHLVDTLPDYWAETVTVGTRKPSPMPAGGVIQVRRVGGVPLTEVSDNARIDLLVWHDTDEDAHDLTATVRAVVHLLATNRVAHRVSEFAGPSRFADPDSDQPRWLLTVEIAVRGTALEPAGS